MELLARRARDATICPSEVARAMMPADWERLMESVRQAGRRLATAGRIVWRQGGKIVSPDRARGPVRFGRA